MPRLIEIALVLSGIGYMLTVPCLVDTTPITMTIFFAFGIPFFAAGFLLYAYDVLRDLRRHKVF